MTFENRSAEPRTARVIFRMTPAERDELNRLAKKADKTAADVIREGIQLWAKKKRGKR